MDAINYEVLDRHKIVPICFRNDVDKHGYTLGLEVYQHTSDKLPKYILVNLVERDEYLLVE